MWWLKHSDCNQIPSDDHGLGLSYVMCQMCRTPQPLHNIAPDKRFETGTKLSEQQLAVPASLTCLLLPVDSA